MRVLLLILVVATLAPASNARGQVIWTGPRPTHPEAQVPLAALASKKMLAIVECVVSGPVISTYRVMHAFRGPPDGTTINMRRPIIFTDSAVPPAPPPPVGTFFLLAGDPRSGDYDTPVADSETPRPLPFDYLVRWDADDWFDYVLLGDLFAIHGPLGSPHFPPRYDDLFALGQRISGILSADEATLRRTIAADGFMHLADCGSTHDFPARSLCASVRNARSDDDLFHAATTWASGDPSGARRKWLASEVAGDWPQALFAQFLASVHDPELLKELRSQPSYPGRSHEWPLMDEHGPRLPPFPTPAEEADALERVRLVDDDRFYSAGGYWALARFVRRCGKNCVEELKALKFAHNEAVRAGAIVYRLILGDPDALVELRERAKASTIGGAWTSVALARRGDKVAAAHAIDLLESNSAEERSEMAEILHNELAALLYNSLWKAGFRDFAHSGIFAVWRANRDKIELVDPWLPLLTSLRLDSL